MRGPVLTLLLKDTHMLMRDPRWRTGLIVSLVALGVPILLVSTRTVPSVAGGIRRRGAVDAHGGVPRVSNASNRGRRRARSIGFVS